MPRSVFLVGLAQKTGLIPQNNSSTKRSFYNTVVLVLLEPWVAAAAGVAYLTSGRFNLARQPQTVCRPVALAACMGSVEVEVHSDGGALAE
jgi:hypothetical protein